MDIRMFQPSLRFEIASALAGTRATVVRRGERHVPAGGWCNEAVTSAPRLRKQDRKNWLAVLVGGQIAFADELLRIAGER